MLHRQPPRPNEPAMPSTLFRVEDFLVTPGTPVDLAALPTPPAPRLRRAQAGQAAATAGGTLRGPATPPLRREPPCAAADLPRHGRGGEGQHHQARHRWRELPRLSGGGFLAPDDDRTGGTPGCIDIGWRCRSAGVSASSTAPTTRKWSPCACSRSCSRRASSRRRTRTTRSGSSVWTTSWPSRAIWRATASAS